MFKSNEPWAETDLNVSWLKLIFMVPESIMQALKERRQASVLPSKETYEQ